MLFCYSESRQQESGAGLYDRVLAKHTRGHGFDLKYKEERVKERERRGRGKEGGKKGGWERERQSLSSQVIMSLLSFICGSLAMLPVDHQQPQHNC